MNFDFVFDTSAWIEYFIGSNLGLKVKACLEQGSVATPTIVLAELSDKYAREEKIDAWKKNLAFIIAKTAIIDLTADIAPKTGQLKTDVRKKFNNNFGLTDAIVYLTSQQLNSKLVTGDYHFKTFKDVVFIGE